MTLLPKKHYPTDRERKRSRYRKLRPEVRYAAWLEDEERCVFPSCRRWVSLGDAHIHEVVFRSDLGDACDLDNAVTTCADCHDHLHVRIGGKLKRIEGSRSEGLRFFARKHAGEEWREVFL